MSTASVPPAWPTPSRLALTRSARALRLEFKRNAVPWVLPLLAALFYFDTVRTAAGFPPVWTLRASVIDNHMVFEFSAFAAGLAAWAGSREGRRKTSDLVTTTARAPWARLSVVLAATLGWLLLAFLAGVAVVYVQTAVQATWGGPPLGPVLVGVAGVTVATVIGFAAGVLFPGRFTAPLAAIGVLVLEQVGFRAALGVDRASGTYALLSPENSPPSLDAGVYFHVAPDLAVVQVMFMGGVAVALFGGLGLASMRAGFTRRLGLVAVLLVAGGVAASSFAFALAGTAKPTADGGWEIPALHSAASDQPVPATPDCTSGSGFQVCVHPAFGFYRSDVAAALDPLAAQITGLPGAPAGAREVAGSSGGQLVTSGITGRPPVFEFSAAHVGNEFGEFYGIPDGADWRAGFQQGLLSAFLEGRSQQAAFAPFDPAQQAVANGLMSAAGTPASAFTGPNGDDPAASARLQAEISAAARRFAGRPASARHAWLAAHLTALRAGQLTLAQIP